MDGKIHNKVDRQEYDLIRQFEIECRNIKVIRFKNEEVFENINNVIKSIELALAPLSSSGEGLG